MRGRILEVGGRGFVKVVGGLGRGTVRDGRIRMVMRGGIHSSCLAMYQSLTVPCRHAMHPRLSRLACMSCYYTSTTVLSSLLRGHHC